MGNDIAKFDIYIGFCIVQNSCKMIYFHLHKIVPKYLVFYVIFQHAKFKENKIFCTWENMV